MEKETIIIGAARMTGKDAVQKVIASQQETIAEVGQKLIESNEKAFRVRNRLLFHISAHRAKIAIANRAIANPNSTYEEIGRMHHILNRNSATLETLADLLAIVDAPIKKEK